MKLKQIVTQMEPETKAPTAESPSVERIAYRPQGRFHPEQWMATIDGRRHTVTPASARLVLDLARDMRTAGNEYRTVYRLQRWGATDGGRKWWVYEFSGSNGLAQHLVEVSQ